jgi:hypothetical protein
MAPVHEVVDAVLLRRDGEVVRLAVHLERLHVDLVAPLARASARTVPVTESDVSCDRWSAACERLVADRAFDITAWMKPVPSRTIRKWILPLDRRLCSQPWMVTCWPS